MLCTSYNHTPCMIPKKGVLRSSYLSWAACNCNWSMRYQTLVFTMWNTQLLLSGQICWLTKVLACEMLPECIPSPWFELTLQAPCKQLWCFYHAVFPWNGHNFNCSFLEGPIVSIWEGFHCNINWLVMPNNSNELSNVDIFIRHNSFVRAHTICFLITTEVTKLS